MSFRVKRPRDPESGGIPMDPETDDAYFKQPRSVKTPPPTKPIRRAKGGKVRFQVKK